MVFSEDRGTPVDIKEIENDDVLPLCGLVDFLDRFTVNGFGFRALGSGFRVQSWGCKVSR